MNSRDPARNEPLTCEQPPSTARPIADTVDVTREYVERPTTHPEAGLPPADAPQIPGYRITGEIARGGMGQVWSAMDFELDREVAIKTLLSGARADRFVTEARITARLPHPGIPPVYRLGELPDGTHYLAMKLIRGRTLAALLAERSSTAEGLARFVQVFEQICQAVGFAHACGIIHRDLKPLNVMVGEFGEVQVMDWGLAKGLRNADCELRIEEPKDVGNAELTAYGAIMGTPSYMAPEQARGEAVDPRADVFALGSILAAILTGQPAFVGKTGHETIAKAAAADLTDVLSRLGQCAAEGELVDLSRQCLAPDREGRPSDANAVAASVTAYRQGVEARLRQAETERAEAVVRETEQRSRRRVVQWSMALVLTLLAAGILGTSYGMLRANEARAAEARQAKEADLKRQAAEKAREAERVAKLDAQTRQKEAETARTEEAQARQRAEGVTDYLVETFRSPDPERAGRTITMAEVLDRSVTDLANKFADDPLTKATLLNAIGQSYMGLGLWQESIPLFEQSRDLSQARLGLKHVDTLASMNNLASAYHAAGQVDRALPLYEETLKLKQAEMGREDPDTLSSMNNLADTYHSAGQVDRALPLYEETLKLTQAKLGSEHPETLRTVNGLARVYVSTGQFDQAIPLLEETLNLMQAKLGPDDATTLKLLSSLAVAYQYAGRLDRAVPLHEEMLKLKQAKLGPEHPETLASMNNLAMAYQGAGQVGRALPLLEETLKLKQAKLGAEHPATLMSMNNLAGAYHSAGQVDRALPLYEETLKLQQAKLGSEHPETLTSMNNLAGAYHAAGQVDRALPLLEETLKLQQAKLGSEHPATLTSMSNLASAYEATGQLDVALPLYQETLKLQQAKLGPEHPATLTTMGNLADAYTSAGRLDLALPLLEETLKLMQAKLGPDHPSTLSSMNNLAFAYQRAGQNNLALPLYQETLKLKQAKLGGNHPSTLTSMGNLALAYLEANQPIKAIPVAEAYVAGKRHALASNDLQLADVLLSLSSNLVKHEQFAPAEGYLHECLPILEQKSPDAWVLSSAKSLLGGALAGQKRLAEAEPLLIAGYEGMKQREDKIPAVSKVRLTQALQRLVDLYTDWDKPEEAARWQRELDARSDAKANVNPVGNR